MSAVNAKQRFIQRLVSVVMLCGLGAASAASGEPPAATPERLTFEATRFATPIKIQLYAVDKPSAKKAADAAFDWMRRIDRVASDYDPDSEVRRLCDHPSGEYVIVSHDLGELILRSIDYARATGGAFDPSIGPLSHVWRKVRRLKRPPTDRELEEAKKSVGMLQRIAFDCYSLPHPDPNTSPHGLKFKLPVDNMRLDFGGIAKGYAVDRVAEILRGRDFDTFLIDAGGDIYAAGKPPGTDGWRVAVESRDTERTVVLTLVDRAVATSGDAYKFFEVDGKRYSHIIDPRTKQPLVSQPQVTVVAFNATDADAMASALSVLGVNDGSDWVQDANRLIREANGGRDDEYSRAARFEEEGVEVVTDNWHSFVVSEDPNREEN